MWVTVATEKSDYTQAIGLSSAKFQQDSLLQYRTSISLPTLRTEKIEIKLQLDVGNIHQRREYGHHKSRVRQREHRLSI